MWRSHASGEIKSLEQTGKFVGYASVFGVVDHQRDMVVRGAFSEAVRKPYSEIKLLWQHQWQEPIGKIEALYEDAHGLYIEAQLLLDVARAKEAYVLLKEGVLNGLSIGYRPERYRMDADSGVRLLHEVSLYEISLVTMPANPEARIQLVKHTSELAPLMVAIANAQEALRY